MRELFFICATVALLSKPDLAIAQSAKEIESPKIGEADKKSLEKMISESLSNIVERRMASLRERGLLNQYLDQNFDLIRGGKSKPIIISLKFSYSVDWFFMRHDDYILVLITIPPCLFFERTIEPLVIPTRLDNK
jgi:hypothetical protein